MAFTLTNRKTTRISRFARLLPVAALAIGFGVGASGMAFAQHSGGGGHGGGGGGFHGGGGGFHGGGGYRGGGWHGGGGWRGGWHGGWGGWGPGWGWGGYYPGFGLAFDPYWYGGYYDLESAPIYAAPPQPDPGAYGQQGAYGPQGPQNYAPTADGLTDNSRGFYRWQVGVESGTCNRPYVGQVVNSLNGATAASFRPGQLLGGISVAPVIGGKIGGRLDVTDQACATQALERTNTGTPVRWETASGIPITFTITKTTDAGGRRCRDFTATATFASQTQSTHGYACKQTDGSWQTMR
jgi:surface antigen